MSHTNDVKCSKCTFIYSSNHIQPQTRNTDKTVTRSQGQSQKNNAICKYCHIQGIISKQEDTINQLKNTIIVHESKAKIMKAKLTNLSAELIHTETIKNDILQLKQEVAVLVEANKAQIKECVKHQIALDSVAAHTLQLSEQVSEKHSNLQTNTSNARNDIKQVAERPNPPTNATKTVTNDATSQSWHHQTRSKTNIKSNRHPLQPEMIDTRNRYENLCEQELDAPSQPHTENVLLIGD